MVVVPGTGRVWRGRFGRRGQIHVRSAMLRFGAMHPDRVVVVIGCPMRTGARRGPAPVCRDRRGRHPPSRRCAMRDLGQRTPQGEQHGQQDQQQETGGFDHGAQG